MLVDGPYCSTYPLMETTVHSVDWSESTGAAPQASRTWLRCVLLSLLVKAARAVLRAKLCGWRAGDSAWGAACELGQVLEHPAPALLARERSDWGLRTAARRRGRQRFLAGRRWRTGHKWRTKRLRIEVDASRTGEGLAFRGRAGPRQLALVQRVPARHEPLKIDVVKKKVLALLGRW